MHISSCFCHFTRTLADVDVTFYIKQNFFCHRNRNLQAAIGAYYDFESPIANTPSMSFVEDVTIGEGESVPPDTPFTKTWRIQNTGLYFPMYGTVYVTILNVDLPQ